MREVERAWLHPISSTACSSECRGSEGEVTQGAHQPGSPLGFPALLLSPLLSSSTLHDVPLMTASILPFSSFVFNYLNLKHGAELDIA